MTRVRPGEQVPGDEGFTLVELMVAIGVFAVLMAIVTTGTIRGFQAIAQIRDVSMVQAEQQNSLIWITRLLRYADNPTESTTPLPWTALNGAGTDAQGNSWLTFTTYSGTGPVDRVPYKADLRVLGNGDLVSVIATPTLVSGYGYCWKRTDNAACSAITEDVRTRVLIRATQGHTPAFVLTYRDAAGAVTPPPVGATDAAWKTWASAVAEVNVRIADDSASQIVDQDVRLVNPR